MGQDSPLALLEWKAAAPLITEGDELQTQINKLSRDVEKLIERRNNLTPDVADFVRSCRDVLAGVHRAEIRKLADYGFEVDKTPRIRKAAKKSALAA